MILTFAIDDICNGLTTVRVFTDGPLLTFGVVDLCSELQGVREFTDVGILVTICGSILILCDLKDELFFRLILSQNTSKN